MNFQMLQGLLNNLIQSYECGDCKSKIDESNIEIMGAAGLNINVEIRCGQCSKITSVKARMYSTDLAISDLDDDKKMILKNKISELEQKFSQKLVDNTDVIKDSEIISLSKILKRKNLGISDLFTK